MDINIGNYTFTEVKQLDLKGFLYLYSNPKEPDVKLLFNEDRIDIIRYILQDDGMVDTTGWRMGKKFPYNEWKPYTKCQREVLLIKS